MTGAREIPSRFICDVDADIAILTPEQVAAHDAEVEAQDDGESDDEPGEEGTDAA